MLPLFALQYTMFVRAAYCPMHVGYLPPVERGAQHQGEHYCKLWERMSVQWPSLTEIVMELQQLVPLMTPFAEF